VGFAAPRILATADEGGLQKWRPPHTFGWQSTQGHGGGGRKSGTAQGRETLVLRYITSLQVQEDPLKDAKKALRFSHSSLQSGFILLEKYPILLLLFRVN
jgi:hypothetical protein